MFTRGWFNLAIARGTMVVGVLALINLVTWSGFLWAIWAADALVLIYLTCPRGLPVTLISERFYLASMIAFSDNFKWPPPAVLRA